MILFYGYSHPLWVIGQIQISNFYFNISIHNSKQSVTSIINLILNLKK